VPPSDAGADHVNVFEPPFPVERERFCGADGAVNATDVTTLDPTSADAPDTFVAVANALKKKPDEASVAEIV
jgi:hypothetical protein